MNWLHDTLSACYPVRRTLPDDRQQPVDFWYIRMEHRNGWVVETPDLCEDRHAVEELCDLLCQTDVDPIHWPDVLEDFLAAVYR